MNTIFKYPRFFWFDSLVIILQIGRHLTILGPYTIDKLQLPYHIGWTLFMLIVYSVRFKMAFVPMKEPEFKVLRLFAIIYIFDIIQALGHGSPSGFVRIIDMIYMFLFIQYLFSKYKEYVLISDTSNLIKPYIALSLYNVCAIILCAILIFLGFLSETSNPLSTNTLLSDNIENGNTSYFFPGYLSISTSDTRVLADYNIPMLTGLSHEPHTLSLLIMPSVFFILGIKSNNLFRTVLLFALYLTVLVISTSTTAIVCMAVVITIEELWSIFVGKGRKLTAVIFLGLLIFLVMRLNLISNLIYEMVVDRITVGSHSSGSMEYSGAMLKYVVTPKSLFGYGNMPLGVGRKVLECNIGLVTCVLDLVLYIWLLCMAVKNVISKDNRLHYIGLGCLYFLLHMLKLSYSIITYPLFVYIVFLLCISQSNSCNHNSQHSQIISNEEL